MEKEMERRLKILANVLHDAAKEAEKCSEYPQQIDELQVTLRSLRFENQYLQNELEKIKAEQKEKEKEFRAALNEEQVCNNTLNARLKETLRRHDELRQKLQETLENKPKDVEVSDALRPTKVAETYQELYDNQWTDAYEEFEKHCLYDEERTTQALLHVLKNTMEFCKTMTEQQNYQLQASLLLTDKKVYFSKLHQSNEVWKKRELKIKPFVKECIGICWMCLIQFPPLKVEFEPNARGRYFNTDVYRPYTKSGASIDFIVWPALLLHENGPVIAKGIAQGLTHTTNRTGGQTAIKEKHSGKTSSIFVPAFSRYKQVSKSANDLSTNSFYPNNRSFERVNNASMSKEQLSNHNGADGHSKKRNLNAFIRERLSRADQKVKCTTTQQRMKTKSRFRTQSADGRQQFMML
ncbi:uncharacterized protein LOC128554806 isoform X2 [Mercenaria mercenaria]|uniref:uncharacterized protein LOC128554806 isoform X2 n=1 Tax=Mercenaria mercenaria TaxID=6596 RepID=UPI00234F5877|nr:uncharacterized protein LOC128554806 isoform X2 [Mercenaria mercenaria]